MSSKTHSMHPTREKKRETFERLMRGDHVLVHLDSTKSDVIVPSQIRGNPALTLKLSYYFQGATTHDEDQIIANLVFSGKFFECVIPWDAIWGMTSDKQENCLWMEDAPLNKLIQKGLGLLDSGRLSESTRAESTQAASSPETDKPSSLVNDSLQSPEEEESDDEASSNGSINRGAVRRAVLRRVK